jgi:hypothetical protein
MSLLRAATKASSRRAKRNGKLALVLESDTQIVTQWQIDAIAVVMDGRDDFQPQHPICRLQQTKHQIRRHEIPRASKQGPPAQALRLAGRRIGRLRAVGPDHPRQLAHPYRGYTDLSREGVGSQPLLA